MTNQLLECDEDLPRSSAQGLNVAIRKQEKPPTFGIRLNTVTGDTRMEKVYSSLKDIFEKQDLIQSGSTECIGILSSTHSNVILIEKKGKIINSFGLQKGQYRILEIEEALYLFERGTLSMIHEEKDAWWTLAELYQYLPIPIAAYFVYGRLRRAGFILRRSLLYSTLQLSCPVTIALRVDMYNENRKNVKELVSRKRKREELKEVLPTTQRELLANIVHLPVLPQGEDNPLAEVDGSNRKIKSSIFCWEVENSRQKGANEIQVVDINGYVDSTILNNWADLQSVVAVVEESEVGYFQIESYTPLQGKKKI